MALEKREEKKRPEPSHLLIALALCALTLLAYANSFQGAFTLDCKQLLSGDKRIQQLTADNLGLILHHTYWWPYGESGLYRPLSTLSYLFNYAILGNAENPIGYHVINILLHLGNVLLVYTLGLRLMGTRRQAFAVAALWSVHPAQTESVTYIVGRPELLAGVGVLGGFLLYVMSTETTGPRRWAILIGAAAATAIGVFSKESGITILGVIALYELAFWNTRRQLHGRLSGLIAIAIPVTAMLLVRNQILAASPPARFPFLDNPLVNSGFIEARLTALTVIARYLWRLVWPITLSADYSWAQIPPFRGTAIEWISLLAVAALAAAAVWCWRRNRTAFFFAGFAAVTFLPASNLLFPVGTIMAERILYLPAIGFCGCLVLIGAALPTRWPLAGPLTLALLLTAYIARTWARNIDWTDDLHMAQATVQTSPSSFKVRKTLAFLLFHSDESNSNLNQVVDQAEKGLAVLDPLPDADNDAESWRFAGNYYFISGDFPRAAERLNRAIAIMEWPGIQPNAEAGYAYRMLALAYLRLNDPQKAANAAERAVQADPFNPERYLQMAEVMARSNHPDQAAITLLQGEALTSDPRVANAAKNADRNRFLCPALANAIAIRMTTGRPDIAQQLKDAATCPAPQH